MSHVSLRIPISSKRFLCVAALLFLITSPAPIQIKAQAPAPVAGVPDQHRAMLSTYCIACHSTRVKSGGLTLEGLDLQNPADNPEIKEKTLRKLRGRLMPPPGNPQPAQKDIDAFAVWMENSLDSNAKGPKAGYVPIQRLNRTEYAASVKALVGVDVKTSEVLPQDIQVEGFDNIAAALRTSPAFLDQYITAARQIAKLAVGSANPPVSNVKHSVTANQEGQLPLPPGTRGGVRFKHNFVADGEYRINILDVGAGGQYTSTLENESTLVIMLDGKIVFRKSVGGPEDQALVDKKGPVGRDEIMARFSRIPVKVEAGWRDVVVAFVDRSRVESDDNVATSFGGIGNLGFGAGSGRMPRLANGVEVIGPFDATGIAKTPSRSLIFVCEPKTAGESACVRKITENLARRAFRRPVTAEDVNRLMQFYAIGRENGGSIDLGIEQIVMGVLASPEFLYRSIRGMNGVLTDLELASRLSYFLWNTGPDDTLLTLAASGGLSKPGALDRQVTRMIADPRASTTSWQSS